jgi:hypothetical protein
MTGPGYVSDEALLGSLATSDRNAMAVLAGRYARAVHDFALRGSLDPVAASEITALVFKDLKPEPGASIGVRARILVAARQAVVDRDNPSSPPSRSKLSADDASFVETRGPSHREPARWAWQAARMLALREYTLLDLVLRRGLTPEDLRTVGGLGHRGIYSSLSRARDAFEEAYVTNVLAKRGDCNGLRELFAGGGTARSLTLRRQVGNHSKECRFCQGTLASFPDAVHAFLALPDLPLPDDLPGRILGLVEPATYRRAPEVQPDIDEPKERPRPRGLAQSIVAPSQAGPALGGAGLGRPDAIPEAPAAERARQPEPPPDTVSEPEDMAPAQAEPASVEEVQPLAEPAQPPPVVQEQTQLPETGEQGVELEPEVDVEQKTIREAAPEPEVEVRAQADAVEEIASPEEEIATPDDELAEPEEEFYESDEEAWDAEDGYDYPEDERGWFEPVGPGHQRGAVTVATGDALAGLRVFEAGVSQGVNSAVSGLAGGRFLRNFFLFGVATAVAIYLGLALIAALSPGGRDSPGIPLGSDASAGSIACKGPLDMPHGSDRRVSFDVNELDGYVVETVTVDPVSTSATLGALSARVEPDQSIVLTSTRASAPAARVDEYRMQLRLTRGAEVAFSSCTVRVSVGP